MNDNLLDFKRNQFMTSQETETCPGMQIYSNLKRAHVAVSDLALHARVVGEADVT